MSNRVLRAQKEKERTSLQLVMLRASTGLHLGGLSLKWRS